MGSFAEGRCCHLLSTFSFPRLKVGQGSFPSGLLRKMSPAIHISFLSHLKVGHGSPVLVWLREDVVTCYPHFFSWVQSGAGDLSLWFMREDVAHLPSTLLSSPVLKGQGIFPSGFAEGRCCYSVIHTSFFPSILK
ncbi:hypothetical protein AVEN_139435-1 [Araneus ventricosus]|uniref:Uncharacterized protein n=1 Tax=Araneus ventricosus TaxID=182803 RepID=A0A4Y2Q1V5_ARAVE|nr:hypothetical protein AVEN_139435-1 [Araneus ventricosus]